MKFSAKLVKELNYYVYIYSDPDTKEVFYVGKGKGNRCFAHLEDDKESAKVAKIKEIQKRGKDPKIEILAHGMELEKTALKVEAAIIDLLDINVLTNQQRGHHSSKFGRMSIEQIKAVYEPEDADIKEPSLLIRINQMFRYGMPPQELYDATRGSWVLGENRNKVELAFAIYDGIVQEVYKVYCWFNGGTTQSTRDLELNTDRWEFIGKVADENTRQRYLYKNVNHYFSKSSQNPIKYVL